MKTPPDPDAKKETDGTKIPEENTGVAGNPPEAVENPPANGEPSVESPPIAGENPPTNPSKSGTSKPTESKKPGRKKSNKPADPAAPPKKKRRPRGDAKSIPTSLRLNKRGFAALRVLESVRPDETRVEIVSNALVNEHERTAAAPIRRYRRVATDDLLLLGEIVADSEEVLENLRKDLIKTKGNNAERKRILANADHEIKNIRQVLTTTCKLIGFPVICGSLNYSDDAKFMINHIKSLMKNLKSNQKTIQQTYENCIAMLEIFCTEDD